MNTAAAIVETIDGIRRAHINTTLKQAKGEMSEMYYEGMRVAYHQCQGIAEKFVGIGEVKE